MKKLIGLLIAAFLVNSTIAQTTAINESFETWPAPEWNVHVLSLGGNWVHSTLFGSNMGYEGNGAAHRINNDNCNNWLVSPQISVISDNYDLSFYELNEDIQYAVYAGVYISTGSADPVDGDFVELSESLMTEDAWIQHVVDLSAYQGEDIYIAFVYNGTWHKWWIDEVVVAPSTLIDGALTEIVNPIGIDPTSGIEDVIVTLHNFGTGEINDADLEWTINGTQQTTYQATGLGLNPGSDVNITVGQYDFTAQGDYLINVNLALSGDINPSNDTIENTYFVTDPKDAALIAISPEGYSPVSGIQDVSVTVVNEGAFTITDLGVSWIANDVAQSEFTANSINLLPGQSLDFTIGQFDFPEGLTTLQATVIVSGDEDLSNNTYTVFNSVNMLWESFEGNTFPPEMWQADNYPLKDYFFPNHGDYYYASMTDDNMFGEISDTLYTPLLQIEAGDSINFWVNNSAFFTNDDKLIWKDGTTGEIHLIDDINSELEQWDEVTMDISAAAGINYIGFVNNNSGSFGMSRLDMITSDATIYHFDNDLGVLDLDFEYLAKVGESHAFNVAVRNYGTNEVNGGDYTVKILNELGEQLAEQNGVTLQSWEATSIEVNYTFTGTEVQKVYAVIDYSADQAIANNSSTKYGVYAVPADIEIENAGSPDLEDLNMPFNGGSDTWTLGSDDVCQSLYYNEEFSEPGYLYGITIYYNEIFGVGQYLPLQLWIKETELEDLSGGWTDFDETQMVFDDTVQIYPGTNSLYIPFDEPLLITGLNNLAIQYHQYDPEWPSTMIKFYTTAVPEGPVRTIRLFDVYNLDLENLPDYWAEFSNFVYTSFVYQPITELGVISGVVHDENSDPMQDVQIEITGSQLAENTNANGEYAFPEVPYATYELNVTSFGYNDITEEVTVNTADVPVDFNMTPLPLANLQGSVFGSNVPDVPLEGVTVSVVGYEDFSGNTNMNGFFLFENVYGNHQYIITFEVYGYHTFVDTVAFEDFNIDMGNIILNQEFISPYLVSTTASLNMAVIEWLQPSTSHNVKLQNDADFASWSFTNEPYEDVWLGNFFEDYEHKTLTSVEIYFGVYEQVQDFISIDILDESGSVIATSAPFLTFNDSLMTIDIPNITIDGPFYAMVHWQDNEFSTDALAIDWSDTTSNTAYIKYPGEDPVFLSDFIGTPNASFLIRVNTLQEDNPNAEGGPVSYNIYRGLADNLGGAEFWDVLNTAPITELVYFDNDLVIDDQEIYTYAVEAVYVEGISEKTFSNFVELITGIEEIQQYDVEVYPNPASSFVNLNGIMGARISIHNMIGAVVYTEDIRSETARINVNDLPVGNYIIRITDPNSDKVMVKKFIIAR